MRRAKFRSPRLIDAALLEQAAGFVRRAKRDRICQPKRGKSIVFLAAVYNLLATGAMTTYEEFARALRKAFD